MRSALIRYRLVAWTVGVALLLLVFVAMPLKYLAARPQAVEIVGPLHGFLYLVYLVVGFDLAVRQRWSLTRTVLILLAGTVPLMSFVAERWATRAVAGQGAAPGM